MTARSIHRMPRRRRIAAAGAVAVAASLLLSACGDQTNDAGDGDTKTKGSDAKFFDQLPKKIQNDGVIKVGSDIAYAPIEFMDEGNKIAGIDPDIAKALGKELGVELKFNNGSFAQLVVGLNSGRYDLVMSAMTDTKERQEGVSKDAKGGADFVNYFQAGSAILVQKGNPKKVESLEDLCGLSVAAQRGTANESLMEEQGKKCDDKIKPFVADKDTDTITQLQTKRSDAVITDYPVAVYNEQTAGGGKLFEVTGDQIDAAPYGIAVNKENQQLRDAVQKALQEIIDNGEYEKVLKKWNAQDGAVEKATVNAGK
ncbi:ABC transporter substrate-binding protein [Streptomyces sp. XM4193]|uniref:ABC transporter substrate-binding protein n=1 Tax=Streptomyces sp. XM4193 TaxID=2929782 RepID=UPI001FF9A1A7|nr:ABC transporter substrate-binding protein [Streptomyces sp. XM4193]MCK1797406.1 ABC transporter substrate-binding protein [Streptomyces sp. XM4193]